MATTVDREGERDRGVGGAFEGDEAEPSFLEGVSTAVPRVEVRLVLDTCLLVLPAKQASLPNRIQDLSYMYRC